MSFSMVWGENPLARLLVHHVEADHHHFPQGIIDGPPQGLLLQGPWAAFR